MSRQLRQVDVFSETPYLGNPLAVVVDGADLSPVAMQAFARWMNLSETTFILPPSDPEADYRVRIFTPSEELPFAGHPTLGTCHVWLETGGRPKASNRIVQESASGLVPLRHVDGRLAFAAPPLRRSGPADDEMAQRVAEALRIDRSKIEALEWVDNGPPWVAAVLPSPADVLAVEPRDSELYIGLVAPYPAGSPVAFEVRAFFPKDGATAEDPVTGSLNASLAIWLTASGRATLPYVASQGGALGREGRIFVSGDGDGIWIGGGVSTCVAGMVNL